MRTVTALLIACCALGQVSFAQMGKPEFKEMEYEFGKIAEMGGKVSHRFEFTNVGDAPLVLQSVNTSCGCTASEWSNEPVLPGMSASVTAVYDPAGRPGNFIKTINVRMNTEPRDVTLYIKGQVIPREVPVEQQFPHRIGDLGIRSSHVSIGQVWKDSKKFEKVPVYNFGKEALKVQLSDLPSHVKVEPSALSLKPQERGEFYFTIDGTQAKDWGLVMQRLRVRVGAVSGDLTLVYSLEENFANMSAEAYAEAPRIGYHAQTIELGSVRAGKAASGSITLTNSGRMPLLVRKVSASCDCLSIETPKGSVAPNGSLVIPFKLKPTAKGPMMVDVTII